MKSTVFLNWRCEGGFRRRSATTDDPLSNVDGDDGGDGDYSDDKLEDQ